MTFPSHDPEGLSDTITQLRRTILCTDEDSLCARAQNHYRMALAQLEMAATSFEAGGMDQARSLTSPRGY